MSESIEGYIPSDIPEIDVGPQDPGLTEREQRVLRCIACLRKGEVNEAIGVRQIDQCTQFTPYDRKYALERLIKKQIVVGRRLDNTTESSRSDPFAKTAYSIHPASEELVGGFDSCPYGRDKFEPSQNPYLDASPLRKSILDCMRCLEFKGKPVVPSYIALCLGVNESSVRKSLELPEKRGDIERHRSDKPVLISTYARQPLAYKPSEKSKSFLAPQEMLDCSISQKEVEAIIANRTPESLAILACIACQHLKVEQGLTPSISLKSIGSCAGQHAKNVVGTLRKAGFLEYAQPRARARGYYVASTAGQKLFSRLGEEGLIASNCSTDVDVVGAERSYERTRDRIAGCLACITSRQKRAGMDIGATGFMIAKCLDLGADFTNSILSEVPITQKGYRAPANIAIYSADGDLESTSPDACNYQFPESVAGISTKQILDVSSKGLTHRQQEEAFLSTEAMSELGTIVHQSADFNEVRLAVRALFASYIPLAKLKARDFSSSYDAPPRDELVQVALTALLESAERWMPDGTSKFPTYAGVVMRQQIGKYIGKYRGYPSNTYWLVCRIESARATFMTEQEREPTDSELLSIVSQHTPIAAVRRALIARRRRLDILSSQYGETRNEASQDIQGQLNMTDLSDAEQRIMQQLSPQEQRIYVHLFNDQLSQAQVAELVDLPASTIARIKLRLAARLGHPSFGMLGALAPAKYAWMDEAECRGKPEFSKSWNNKHVAVCVTCPVKAKCSDLYNDVGNSEARGIWGGKSAKSLR